MNLPYTKGFFDPRRSFPVPDLILQMSFFKVPGLERYMYVDGYHKHWTLLMCMTITTYNLLDRGNLSSIRGILCCNTKTANNQ